MAENLTRQQVYQRIAISVTESNFASSMNIKYISECHVPHTKHSAHIINSSSSAMHDLHGTFLSSPIKIGRNQFCCIAELYILFAATDTATCCVAPAYCNDRPPKVHACACAMHACNYLLLLLQLGVVAAVPRHELSCIDRIPTVFYCICSHHAIPHATRCPLQSIFQFITIRFDFFFFFFCIADYINCLYAKCYRKMWHFHL